ncbi:DUF3093 domain-containing protein [Amnibacterium sp. CER49]|uniref:DUF3093 domain-containing protein n=1 Tax=Amnibacterium sp. CER49 TaxID=3039161 RepID=UPI00244AEB78|nr:DUF3093 domain-containing protein [Amnibacterium sp. CER49]MDH2442327.1 DUF3093 domain-containing protein [Amnibacterium sp. CER49]
MQAYRERLVPGIGTMLAFLLLAPGLLLILLPIDPTLGVVVAILGTIAVEVALVLTAPVLEVTSGELRAGRAHIEVGLTGAAEVFRAADATRSRGVELDARAYTVLRGWVDPVVRVPILDPADPAPYWVLSTRHPERLAAALEDARAVAGSPSR